jgi:hypothetical protein
VPKRLQRMLVWFIALYFLTLLIQGRHIPRLYELYLRGIPTTGTITQRGGDFSLSYIYVVQGRRYVGFAKVGIASIPISDVGDPIYLTYLPRDPAVNVAGDVKDLLLAEIDTCEEWIPWIGLAVIVLFGWNALMRSFWLAQTPFEGSRYDRVSRFLFGD